MAARPCPCAAAPLPPYSCCRDLTVHVDIHSPVSLQRSRIVMSSMAPKRATAETSITNRTTPWIGFRPGASLPVAFRGFSDIGSSRLELVLIPVSLNKSQTAGLIICHWPEDSGFS